MDSGHWSLQQLKPDPSLSVKCAELTLPMVDEVTAGLGGRQGNSHLPDWILNC